MVIVSGLLILTAIILGAFTAHAFKEVLSPASLASFETGVRYQMYMGLALLMLGLNYHKFRKKNFKLYYGLILIGTLMFSLSIYLLNLADLMHMPGLRSFMGPITPLGGTLMIAGWAIFIFQFIKSKEAHD